MGVPTARHATHIHTMYRRAVTASLAGARRGLQHSAATQAFVRPAALPTSRAGSVPASFQSRPFSNTLVSRSHGESDGELCAKLTAELNYETENANPNEEPEFLQAFKSTGIWTIEDKAGADEIALTRKFGNETIKILFSIADIDNTPADSANEAATEEGEEAAEGETEEASQNESLPIRTAITISKGKGQGALTVDAVAQDGLFLVDNISLYKDESLALELTSEADWKRRGLYMGPAFDHLDESLQTDFESFLEERGIDSNLALFIPDLAEHKEQKEYVKWLEGVRKFVEA